MNISSRRYEPGDFLRIRDFLVKTFPTVGREYNWFIDRWNFTYSMSRLMHAVPLEDWENRIRIWEANGEIVAVVNSEGELRGEAFFQFSRRGMPEELLAEMFEFAESNLTLEKNNERFLILQIPEGDHQLESMAKRRGYVKEDWSDTKSVVKIEERPEVLLPEGFSIRSGGAFSNEAKGSAHARAFGYVDTPYAKRSPIGYEAMSKTPDYREDLDLYVVDDSGEIASFCTMWFDKENKIGILEPVGTIPEYRRRGLGKAVIAEGLERIAALGAKEAYVGSRKPFYLAIGFTPLYTQNVWKKVVD